jgi:CHASE2 domain-containing sensor protein
MTMRLPLSWRISFKHWFWRKWIALKYRALEAWDGWSGFVRYLYDSPPALMAGQGLAAAVIISAGLVLLRWLAPVIHSLAWAYGLTLLALAALKAIDNRRNC